MPIYSVGLLVPSWLLVLSVFRTSVMVGGFQSEALISLQDGETGPSAVCPDTDWQLCCLIVGVHALAISVPLYLLILLG